MRTTFALILLGLCIGGLAGFFAGFKVGYTEIIRKELEYGQKLRAQIEADLTPEDRNDLDWERHES